MSNEPKVKTITLADISENWQYLEAKLNSFISLIFGNLI